MTAPSAPQMPSERCKRCGRPISPTPFGFGHSETFPRLVEGDRHYATPARVDPSSPLLGVGPGTSI